MRFNMTQINFINSAKKILSAYLTNGGIVDEQIVTILIQAIKKHNVKEFNMYLYPLYPEQTQQVREVYVFIYYFSP
jgi:intergrase/recombinase